MTCDKSFFTSLADFNGGNVTLKDGSVVRVGGRGSISILGCPKLKWSSLWQKLDIYELWHRRLGHINYRDLVHKVRGILKMSSQPKPICGGCLKGPMRTESKGGKGYMLVVVDDFSGYSFACFLREKSKAIKHLKSLCTRIQVEIGYPIREIKSDKGKEFDNINVDLFYYSKGIKHEYSAPGTTQQNGVVERKIRVLQEMARVILHMHNIPIQFWVRAINIACCIVNKVFLRPRTKKTFMEALTTKPRTTLYVRLVALSGRPNKDTSKI
ncbi:Retrovirus-related Pol polyprotein from transposon TNT 1-94 [Vitis vinifera]|uniref:Retrovirus-related Pol polyprotein from transposon TNT 1-94 n=1 Tax=Vitis vinifera TaxID=29760 RepID=A0A438DGE3_VITVI|nr:Retrovirus-related Pol polyprotein from transposon TNT 1-94 [Vitis vinifera]